MLREHANAVRAETLGRLLTLFVTEAARMGMRTWMARLLVGAGVVLTTIATLRADDPLKEVGRLYATAAYRGSVGGDG